MFYKVFTYVIPYNIEIPPQQTFSLFRYKQIVDDIIIQTDKNASDIDVENIVNRKVRRMLKKRKQILFDFF